MTLERNNIKAHSYRSKIYILEVANKQTSLYHKEITL